MPAVYEPDDVTFAVDAPAPAPAEPENMGSASPAETATDEKAIHYESSKKHRIGLRTKFFLIFILIPIVLFVSSGNLFLRQMNHLSTIISDESSQVVTTIAESIISEKAYAVAREVGLYLKTHTICLILWCEVSNGNFSKRQTCY